MLLHLLDPVGDPRDELAVVRQVVAELAALELDRGAAGHVGDEQPHVVADVERVHVLVEVGVDLDRAGVQPRLVRERRRADVRLARRRRHVGDLGDGVGDAGGLAQQALGQDVAVQLELEVGDDGDEVGVAGALAVAVDAALHVRGAGGDGGQRVGDRAAAVVVGVDADAGAGRLDDVEHDVRDPVGQHAAVGVAERDDLGARLGGGAQHLEGVRPVAAVAVEEVLGVEEDRLPLRTQVADGVAHHREVLLQRRAQRELDVAVVRLRDQGHDARAAVAEGGDERVVGSPYAGAAGGAERREPARAAGRAPRSRGGRTRCPWDWRPAIPPRCSPRPGRRAAGRC